LQFVSLKCDYSKPCAVGIAACSVGTINFRKCLAKVGARHSKKQEENDLEVKLR